MTTEIPMWIVYGIINKEDERLIYVGMTSDLKKRLYQHKANPESAVYRAWQKHDLSHCVLGAFVTKEAARHLERALLASIPQLLNRTHSLSCFRFWEPVRAVEMAARRLWNVLCGDCVESKDYRGWPYCDGDMVSKEEG